MATPIFAQDLRPFRGTEAVLEARPQTVYVVSYTALRLDGSLISDLSAADRLAHEVASYSYCLLAAWSATRFDAVLDLPGLALHDDADPWLLPVADIAEVTEARDRSAATRDLNPRYWSVERLLDPDSIAADAAPDADGAWTLSGWSSYDPRSWDTALPSVERAAREALGWRHQCETSHRNCYCRMRGNEHSQLHRGNRLGEHGSVLGEGAQL